MPLSTIVGISVDGWCKCVERKEILSGDGGAVPGGERLSAYPIGDGSIRSVSGSEGGRTEIRRRSTRRRIGED